MVALLVEERPAAVPGERIPGAGKLLEADARDPQHRIAAVTVLLGLDAVLDELLVGRERLGDAGLLQHLLIVVPHPDGGEIGQRHQLAVDDGDLLGEARVVLHVVGSSGKPVERLDHALLHEVGEREGRGLRDIDLLAAGIHRRELGRVIVERGDRALDLHAPVGLELPGDAGVDVAIGPDHEVELVDLGPWRRGPWSRALGQRGARAQQAAAEAAAQAAPEQPGAPRTASPCNTSLRLIASNRRKRAFMVVAPGLT